MENAREVTPWPVWKSFAVFVVGFLLIGTINVLLAAVLGKMAMLAIITQALPTWWLFEWRFFKKMISQRQIEQKIVAQKAEREIANKYGHEGDVAFKCKLPRSSNPYLLQNTDDPNEKFAQYWDRGYAVAERAESRGKVKAE